MNPAAPSLAAELRAPRRFNGLVVALVVSLVAGSARWLLDPLVGNRVPFATFFIAIVVAVRFGGLWSALLTMLLGLGWALLMWFPSGPASAETLVSSAVYVFSSLAIMALGSQMHSAEALAAGRARQLQDTVYGLRASQGRLQLATEVSGIGVFEWDVPHDRLTGENPEAYRILGRAPGDAKLSLQDFIDRHLHPDDRQRVRQVLERAKNPGERFQVVFRSRRNGGEWRWLEVAGRFLFDAAGAPTQLVGVIADISERKELEDNLRKMAADLSEADRRKDEFLATLAHELRNPLAPIRNGIELLKRVPGGSPQTQGVVGVMERQMSHMVRLVDDLIDVSRITRNKLELRTGPVELAEVIGTAVEACRPAIDAKQHQLDIALPPAPIRLDADLTRLVQVFSNLLNNAVKYTDPGGRIGIAAQLQEREVLVSITDNGSGIPRALLPQVFDMFTQLDRSLERSQGGLGIGLSMVKRLVELHGGSVELHSEGPGRGSVATVRLPLSAQAGTTPVAAAAAPAQARRRILVVDDNADAAQSLGDLLELIGHDIMIAGDGLEAVEMAAVFRPDVVMLDLGMPRMNGYEACRQIRAQPANADTLIIAVTGWGQEQDRARSTEAGFDRHLTKPVDPATVEALLAELPPPRA
jgi:two-component system CheB/CheR fusion protein